MFIGVPLMLRGFVMLEAISQVNHEGKVSVPFGPKVRALLKVCKKQVLLLSEYH